MQWTQIPRSVVTLGGTQSAHPMPILIIRALHACSIQKARTRDPDSDSAAYWTAPTVGAVNKGLSSLHGQCGPLPCPCFGHAFNTCGTDRKDC